MVMGEVQLEEFPEWWMGIKIKSSKKKKKKKRGWGGVRCGGGREGGRRKGKRERKKEKSVEGKKTRQHHVYP